MQKIVLSTLKYDTHVVSIAISDVFTRLDKGSENH